MIIVLKTGITPEQKAGIVRKLEERGRKVKEIQGKEETVLGAVGMSAIDPREIQIMDGVAEVLPITKPYKLVSRELKKEDSVISVGPVKIGGNRIAVIAGPCAVESEEQIMRVAESVREAGAVILRGGAFKPRTSPYAFQGLGEEGVKLLKRAGDAFGMPVVTEVTDPKEIPFMEEWIDMFQIGARNMQNFELLKAVGRTGKPVLLKRGMSATIEEWLMAAEYLMSVGDENIVLCERGIRTFEKATRNTLDCSSIALTQKLTHLPVIGDPSHATGIRDMVAPMSLAIIASGASGLEIEVHCCPEKAMSDGPQSLYPSQFAKLMSDVQAIAPVVGKSLERIPRFFNTNKTPNTNSSKTSGEAVAFQGVRGAYSERAILRTFDENTEVMPCGTFKDVFEAVSKGDARFGMVPIENTLGGTIYDTIDLLEIYPSIQVVGEQQIRVQHNLIGLPDAEISDIRKVYSHPQGLLQSKQFLETTLRSAEQVPFFDTAGAVEFISRQGDKSLAAIAGEAAASHYGMKILAGGIESNSANYTRFYIISREEDAASFRSAVASDRAAIVFSVKDESGALVEVLGILKDAKINMKKLESRPIPGKPWEYFFFAELELNENFAVAMEKIRACCPSFRILGDFKAAH